MPLANPFLLVVMIVFGFCLIGTLNHWLRSRNALAASDAETAEMEQELAWLRDRVNTLERLATDGETDLRKKFRGLD